jgi:hypothetical protein
MGLETIAIAGLGLSALGTGYSMYSSSKQEAAYKDAQAQAKARADADYNNAMEQYNEARSYYKGVMDNPRSYPTWGKWEKDIGGQYKSAERQLKEKFRAQGLVGGTVGEGLTELESERVSKLADTLTSIKQQAAEKYNTMPVPKYNESYVKPEYAPFESPNLGSAGYGLGYLMGGKYGSSKADPYAGTMGSTGTLTSPGSYGDLTDYFSRQAGVPLF